MLYSWRLKLHIVADFLLVIMLCAAEYTTALLVVCSISLKPLIFRKRRDPFQRSGSVNRARIEDALKRYAERTGNTTSDESLENDTFSSGAIQIKDIALSQV